MANVKLNLLEIGSKIELSNASVTLSVPEPTNSFIENASYVMNWQMSKKRSANAKVKAMSEISGTTAKPWKQKGTGRARQGSRRSVQFVGGRTCHGPANRKFSFSIPKKIVKKSLLECVSMKALAGEVSLYKIASSEINKTSTISRALKNMFNGNILFIYNQELIETNVNMLRAIKNIKSVKTLEISGLNSYDLVKYKFILFDSESFLERSASFNIKCL